MKIINEYYELLQIDDDTGGLYIKGGTDLPSLLSGGAELVQRYPGTAYIVQTAGKTIWQSDHPQRYILARQIGDLEQLIMPGCDPVKLLQIGSAIASANPDWALAVRDSERVIIWSNKKDALGQAEDADTKNG